MTLLDAQHRWHATRSVSELWLTDQIVVWSLRRYRASGSRIEALVPTYRQIFGLTGVERALAAFGTLVAAIEAHRRPALRPASFDALRLSLAECHILDLLAAVEAQDDDQAGAAAASLVKREGQTPVVAAARQFVVCLAAAGRTIAAADPGACRLPQQVSADADWARQPTLERREDLTGDEGLVLHGIRLWVSHAKEDREGAAPLGERLSAHGAGNARSSFNGMLYNLSVAALRPIDVRCLACPNLSPDEARMIHGIACAQLGLEAGAAEMLGAWLAPAAVRLTIIPVLSLAATLAASRVFLPLRDWDFARLEQLSAPFVPHVPEGAVIH